MQKNLDLSNFIMIRILFLSSFFNVFVVGIGQFLILKWYPLSSYPYVTIHLTSLVDCKKFDTKPCFYKIINRIISLSLKFITKLLFPISVGGEEGLQNPFWSFPVLEYRWGYLWACLIFIFRLIFYVILSTKTRLLRSINLKQMREGRERNQRNRFWGPKSLYDHFWPYPIFIFSSKTKNHLLSLIPTIID